MNKKIIGTEELANKKAIMNNYLNIHFSVNVGLFQSHLFTECMRKRVIYTQTK